MAHLFAANGILLVRELERSECDSVEVVLVMQRCVAGVVDFSIDGEVDVLETKGLGA